MPQGLDVPHLLVSLLEQEQGLAPLLLDRAGVGVDSLKRKAEQELEKLPRVSAPSGGDGMNSAGSQEP